MAVLIREDVRKRFTEWHKEIENGVFPIPLDLVHGAYRGVRLGSLSRLYPEEALRTYVFDIARFWVKTRGQRGWELTDAPDDMLLWGPYKHRDWTGTGSAREMRAVGWTEDEIFASGMADFVLQAAWKTNHPQLPTERGE